ncbi:MAG: hypothetical protein IJN40_04630 [Clostridia bacterium]|nr:hypothetical protein [Clostridia bacterium]
MWQAYNHIFFGAEVVLLIVGIYLLFHRVGVVKTFIYGAFVVALNFLLYAVPVFYAREVLNSDASLLMSLLDCASATVKQFVGEIKTEAITDYATIYPKYIHIFSFGAALAVMTSFLAALGLFGRQTINSIKLFYRAGSLSRGSCDVVFGSDEASKLYVKKQKNAIIAVGEDEKEKATTLMESGFTVLRKDFSEAFFKSRYFGRSKEYNIIFPNNNNNFIGTVDTIVSYLKSGCRLRNVYFYVEADEGFIEILQNKITNLDKELSEEGVFLRERINFFSRNELIARKLVESNPLTRYMPEDFFAPDRSIKEEKKLNVFMLGITPLSMEIYKQFVINNQLVGEKNGTYVSHMVNYYIADDKNIESLWCFGGLKKALAELSGRCDDYFELPEMPYNFKHINVNPSDAELDEISAIIKKPDSYSFVFIDSGNTCTNLELCNRLHLLIGNRENNRIFVCDPSCLATSGNDIVSYGDIEKIFCHDVIVDESLYDLAKRINKSYNEDLDDNKKKESEKTQAEKEAEKKHENKLWVKLGYFDKYSNISLATNMRMKLNLLGYDYVKDNMGAGLDDVKKEKIAIDLPYKEYLNTGKEQALLAQEHLRWNAYHLLNGYLPLKKSKLSVRLKTQKELEKDKLNKETADKMELLVKTTKDVPFKKHICITSYKALNELSESLLEYASRANPKGEYTIEDFEYYGNDGMLLKIIHDFLESKKHSVITRNKTE